MTSFIDDWYKNVGYFDTYSGSVLLLIAFTCITLFVAAGSRILIHREEIAADWENRRCNPAYIPFAGFINKPYDKTAFEYTQENFEFCMQDTTANTTGTMVAPLTQITNQLTAFYQDLANSINAMRDTLNKVRDNTRTFTEDVMGRTLNVVIPLQQIFLSFRDMIGKSQGILTASLFTLLGTYDTLQSLMGAILELVVKLLVALAAVVIGLWATPATWPAAATTSLVFMSLSIPLAIIAAFMSSVLHVHSSSIPKLRCFDRQTPIWTVPLADGIGKTPCMHGAKAINIQYIEPGDWILGSLCGSPVQVTGKFKILAADLPMYRLGTVCVSGTHLVRHAGNWIRVQHHPHAVALPGYTEPYVYCLTTASKEIYLDGYQFTDWDEAQLQSSPPPQPGKNAGLGLGPGLVSGLVSGLVPTPSSTIDIDLTANQGFDAMVGIGFDRSYVYASTAPHLLYGTVSLLGNRWHALSVTGAFYVADENGKRHKVPDYNAAYDLVYND